MPDLTWDERVALAHEVGQALDEPTTDLFLDLLEARARPIVRGRMPKWLKVATKVPFVPDPVDWLRGKLDDQLPELLRDPLQDAIMGGDDASTGPDGEQARAERGGEGSGPGGG